MLHGCFQSGRDGVQGSRPRQLGNRPQAAIAPFNDRIPAAAAMCAGDFLRWAMCRAAIIACRGEVKSFVRTLLASPSHHRPGGGYQNPWPRTQPHSFADFLRWRFVERRTRPLEPDPPRDSLPKREPEIV